MPLKNVVTGEIIGVAGVSLDITDRNVRKLEKELQEAKAYAEGQRDMLWSLPHLAGGVGHELRTPLSAGRLQVQALAEAIIILVGLYRKLSALKYPDLPEILRKKLDRLKNGPKLLHVSSMK